jgi:hypothetical protein
MKEDDMPPLIRTLRTIAGALWRGDRLLTAVAVGMLVALAASVVGLWVDPRTITGAPAWLKPAKFAASIAIYTVTLAWIFGFLPAWTKTRRIVSRTTAAVMILELAVIALQAWRGTTSHFNVATALDAALFTLMGTAIVVQTLTSVAVAVALWRQHFADAALGWALRLGLTLTIVGAFTGGLMTRPTMAQLAEARATQRLAVAGAHTVGAPDGGPGLPGTGWSRTHGDLRVAHFVGLHAVQALPLVALLLRRRVRHDPTRARITVVAAGSYAAVFAVVLWQSLRGQSLVAPDALTVTVFAAWLVATASSVWLASGRGRFLPAVTRTIAAH